MTDTVMWFISQMNENLDLAQTQMYGYDIAHVFLHERQNNNGKNNSTIYATTIAHFLHLIMES